MFDDGEEHPYFAFVGIDGSGFGASVVPVLSNGKILMIVEQRPAQGLVECRNCYLRMNDGAVLDLRKFGPWSSLEFPGGSFRDGESIAVGSLRELGEESGIREQEVRVCYTAAPPFTLGSDLAWQNFFVVAFLGDEKFEPSTSGDGGLRVLALTHEEVKRAIWSGVIVSGQAGIMSWYFYQDITSRTMGDLDEMMKQGFIVEATVTLST